MTDEPNGIAGGLICLLAIFASSFLLVIGALPFWDGLRRVGAIQNALLGVNAVVVIDRGGVDGDDTRRVGEYLRREGALDVFAVRISVGPAPVEVSTETGAA